jgi:single-stranded DNA-specific DHH superfamily exonuclease
MISEKSRKAGYMLSVPGRKLLLYHADADGVCSAALLLKFFPDFEAIPREGPIMDDRFLRELRGKKPALLVGVDLPLDQEVKKLKKFQKAVPGLELLVIDHHIIMADLNREGMLHINPRFEEKEAYIPASYAVYRLLEELGKPVKKYVWVSAIGVIGDYGFRDCDDLIGECMAGCPGSIKFSKSIFDSHLGQSSEIISGCITLKSMAGAKMALKRLLECETYKDFLQSPVLVACKDEVQAEIRRLISEFTAKPPRPEKGVIFCRIGGRLNLNSVISSILSARFPDNVVIVSKAVKRNFKVSARCQSGRINVGTLLKKASAGIGSGGGHEKAAGALVNDWEKFRKRVMEMV